MNTKGTARPAAWSGPSHWGLVLVFVVTTAAMAAPYWTAGYDSIREDGIFGSWYLVALLLVAGTFLAGTLSDVPLVVVSPLMLTCVPLAVIGRVLIDTASQPTAHNLWPLEVVLAGTMSIPFVLVGTALAWGVRRLSPSTPD